MSRCFPCLAVALLALTVNNARALTVAGSDFLPESLAEAIEVYAASRGDDVTVDFRGSAHAVRTFEAGDAFIAIFASKEKQKPDVAYRLVKLGYKAAILVVQENNPIQTLNADQISSIFATGPERPAQTWGDLGATGDWASRNLQPTAVHPYHYLALPILRDRMMPGSTLRNEILMVETQSAAEGIVVSDASAIAVVDSLPADPGLRTVSISERGDTYSFPPTLQNINFGDYPASLTFYIALPLSLSPRSVAYADFLLTDRIADLLEQEGFFPLLENDRRRLREQVAAGEI